MLPLKLIMPNKSGNELGLGESHSESQIGWQPMRRSVSFHSCTKCSVNFSPPVSLNEVSSRNRSYAGTNHASESASRGDQSSLELEAIAAVHELSFAVQTISVSEMLPRTPELIFVNVTTVEAQPYCLELTMKGWRVASFRQDCMNGDFRRMELHTKYYENPYELMDKISPGYRLRFGEKLAAKLRALQTGDEEGCLAPQSSYVQSPTFPEDMEPPNFDAQNNTETDKIVPSYSLTAGNGNPDVVVPSTQTPPKMIVPMSCQQRPTNDSNTVPNPTVTVRHPSGDPDKNSNSGSERKPFQL